MKKNCIIINASRGGIINESDLNKSLNENKIFGAGLDVFDTEPPDNNNPLLKNDKTFLSPHTAAFTEECMVRMGKETIQNIIDFFDKKLEKIKNSEALMKINLKNFGLLEVIVIMSLIYVVGMLIWTASTRPAVEAKANLVKENHKKSC